jgi:hypothetical protein
MPDHYLIRRFIASGFGNFRDGELALLSQALEREAASTGLSSSLFLADAVRAVLGLFTEHEECGGVRIGFINYLDRLARDRLPQLQACGPTEAAQLAIEFRDEIMTLISAYNPAKENGL